MDFEVNFLTVLVAAVVSMGVGFLWYSSWLFGNQWMKLMGLTKDNMKDAQKEMGKLYSLSFIATLVTAYVLFQVVMMDVSYEVDPIGTSMSTAFWVWLGFVAPVQMTDVLFGGKKWNLFAINTGYQLTSLLAMGFVVGLL